MCVCVCLYCYVAFSLLLMFFEICRMLCEMKMRAVGFVMHITADTLTDDFQSLFQMHISPQLLQGLALFFSLTHTQHSTYPQLYLLTCCSLLQTFRTNCGRMTQRNVHRCPPLSPASSSQKCIVIYFNKIISYSATPHGWRIAHCDDGVTATSSLCEDDVERKTPRHHRVVVFFLSPSHCFLILSLFSL